MSEISEFDKIHNYVTWPDRERVFFPNGDVTIGALGFPVANESGVANDGSCGCADDFEDCEIPPKVNVEFNTFHSSLGTMTSSNLVILTTPVDLYNDGNNVVLFMPVKKLTYVKDSNPDVLTVELFDNVSSVSNKISMYLVKSAGSSDPLTTTQLITNNVFHPGVGNNVWVANHIGASNDFDLSSSIDNGKFAVKIQVNQNADNLFVCLTNQRGDAIYTNGVYEIDHGTISYICASVNGAEISDTDREKLLADGKAMDNVGTCCGPHFRKTYSHDEIHNYVYEKVGATASFGLCSDVVSCQGALVNWLVSSGQVDIGTGKEFPVYVNGFGLGSFFVGQCPTKYDVKTEDVRDNLPTWNPWLTWSYGTTRNEKATNNAPALPRDWPFTLADGSFNSVDDVSVVTLVKNGVFINGQSEPVGNLSTDVLNEEDPSQVVAHRFYNKHHFVLNQKYVRDPDGGYEVKPFFINLPASLDTEDGETYEITVSIQNQPEDNIGPFVNEKDISAYYAAMSQPRVYVMGGRQQFSNKKLPVDNIDTVDVDTFTISTNRQACDINGTSLQVGTEVRANVTASIDGYSLPSFTVFGTISSTSVSGTTITCEGKIPSDRNYHRDGVKFTICGIAYLNEDDNPSTTRMGLVRDSSMFSGDRGSGVTDEFDQYNTFYSLDDKAGHRLFPHVDRRYFLASVYQTATNTFPWRMNNRRKLQRLDRVWTDITACDGIIKKVYLANQSMLDDMRFALVSRTSDGQYNLDASHSPVTYGTDATWINLASVLRVGLAEDLHEMSPVTLPYGNPVRQAANAMRNFTNDLYNMRLLVKSGYNNAEVTTKYISIRERTDWPSANSNIFNSADIDYGVDSSDSIRSNISHCTLRSLPEYVVNADRYELNSEFSPSSSDSVLFTEEGDGNGHGSEFFDYYNTSPYETYDGHPLASSAAYTENACDMKGYPRDGRVFSDNSVIKSILGTCGILSGDTHTLNDMRRYADVGLRIVIDVNDANLTNSDLPDWLDPFTGISYKDGAPSLSVSTLPPLSAAQKQWVAFDAVQTYRYMMGDVNDPVNTVSSCMPYLSGDALPRSKALASFIEKYVVSCGAEMPIHFYKGRRIELYNGTLPDAESAIYINDIYRVRKRMEADGCDAESMTKFITHYIDDNFASVLSSSRNPNADSVDVTLDSHHAYSLSATVPPYKAAPEYTNGTTYTRVRMQFTFSQRAGRWYTTEYRQYPCSYLTPLYGNDALVRKESSIFDSEPMSSRLWRNSACTGFNSYRNVMYSPYSSYPPMDVTLGCVPYLFDEWPYDADGKLKASLANNKDVIAENKPIMAKLEMPWKPYNGGGIDLYPPANVNGEYKSETNGGVHANFWSVREYVRPATSILSGTDVPKYEDPDTYNPSQPNYRSGGLESDPTLYSMFDFPKSGRVIYHLPSINDPSTDRAFNYILYQSTPDEVEQGMPTSGVIQTGGNNVFGLVYGLSDHDTGE